MARPGKRGGWRRARGFNLRRVAWERELDGHQLTVWHAERVGGIFRRATRYLIVVDGHFLGDAATEAAAKCGAVLLVLDGEALL